MASLEALAKSYRAKKSMVSKLRRKGEDRLRETLSLKRRSSSGLASLERKKESISRQIGHVLQVLNQYSSQKESIARLRAESEERIRREQDVRDSTRQQIDFGPAEEKAAAEEIVRLVEEKIVELQAGIREREAAESRLERMIKDLEREKARLEAQVKRQSLARPKLVEQLRSSSKAESVLRPHVESLVRREEQASRALQSAVKRLVEAAAKRKPARRKGGRTAARKARRGKSKVARRSKPKAAGSRTKGGARRSGKRQRR